MPPNQAQLNTRVCAVFLVIVILFVMRKRYQKDSLANMKNSGEIHEQLVTYDEEGGGEMDTNGYERGAETLLMEKLSFIFKQNSNY